MSIQYSNLISHRTWSIIRSGPARPDAPCQGEQNQVHGQAVCVDARICHIYVGRYALCIFPYRREHRNLCQSDPWYQSIQLDSASDCGCTKLSPEHCAVYATGVHASFHKALDSFDTNSSIRRIDRKFPHQNNTVAAPSNLRQRSQYRSERYNSQYNRKCTWLCHPEYVHKKFHRPAPNGPMGFTTGSIIKNMQ